MKKVVALVGMLLAALLAVPADAQDFDKGFAAYEPSMIVFALSRLASPVKTDLYMPARNARITMV